MASYQPTTITDLPDELILEIIRYFSCIRSNEPQATAFKEKEKEKSRQLENRTRQVALHSLCLTTHRLRHIATPNLYASFAGTATYHGYEPLKLFHRTLSNPGNGFGLKVRLTEFLQYAENRLCDYLGNNLYEDTDFYAAVYMVSHYFELLADIVKHAPNLQLLSIVSLESYDVSFWKYLTPSNNELSDIRSCGNSVGHRFRKLRTLCFQVHTGGQEFGVNAAALGRICVAMMGAPCLTDIRASGVTSSDLNPSPFGTFKKLRRIEITECLLDLEDVVGVLAACKDLQHIVCDWAYLDCREADALSNLFNGLLRHNETLETLLLDMREVRFEDTLSPNSGGLDSFRSFTALKSLIICEKSLFGDGMSLLDSRDQDIKQRIAQLLPKNLESCTLLLDSSYGYRNDSRLDGITPLWHLAQDSKKELPNLKEVNIRYPLKLRGPKLAQAFEAAGLQFGIIRET